ncbi:MAG: hypothetical protein M5U09_18865 [Gammaproteobacteria bacterium]|nr:hypothetical protein [Gammaproteobacteria bacterium]
MHGRPLPARRGLRPSAIAADCDDGDACTLDDACIDGHCFGGFLTVECRDGDPLHVRLVRPAHGRLRVHDRGQHQLLRGRRPLHGGRPLPGRRLRGQARPSTATTATPARRTRAGTGTPASSPCYHEPLTGGCCDNGQYACDDRNPCTDDLCVDGGCVNVNNAAACDDFDACTSNDTCFEGACAGLPRDCDDDNDCTEDTCQSATGCRHTPLEGSCDDANVCTRNDRCQFGQCTGTFIDCRDTNPCTDDVCDPVAGCQNPFNTAPCEDGNICTAPDACSNGTCVGAAERLRRQRPVHERRLREPDRLHAPAGQRRRLRRRHRVHVERPLRVRRVHRRRVDVRLPAARRTGHCHHVAPHRHERASGSGLDIDGTPTRVRRRRRRRSARRASTTRWRAWRRSPTRRSSALAEGSFFLLMQHIGMRTDGQSYELAPWPAEITNEACAYQTTTCDFLLSPSGFTEDYEPIVSLANARISGSTFTAGGVGFNFVFNLPLLRRRRAGPGAVQRDPARHGHRAGRAYRRDVGSPRGAVRKRSSATPSWRSTRRACRSRLQRSVPS